MAEVADVPLRWRRLLEFYDHRETQIRATAQVVLADVVDSHRAQQELIELPSWVRNRWWLRLSPEDVDAHNESFMDPQAFLELPCPVRRRMHLSGAALWQSAGRVRAEHGRANAAGGRSGGHECARGCGCEQCPVGCPGKRCFEQRYRALCQTVREEFDGYRAHIAVKMQEDIPAHVEARIAEVPDFFRGAVQQGCPPSGTTCPRAL